MLAAAPARTAPTTLLGPQRLRPTLGATLEALGATGAIATVTAGWQGREREDQELEDHLGGRAIRLELHRRVEAIFERDPELRSAHRDRQDELRHAQGLYRLRLGDLMHTVRTLDQRRGNTRWLQDDRQAALDLVRDLDRRHLERVRRVHEAFFDRWQPWQRDAVASERRELEQLLDGAAAVAIAGGHVAVLANRVRLVGLLDLIADRPLVGWSAGAMLMTERIVLFHDSPPQGYGHAEVLEPGLGLVPDVVALPHAHRRLQLEDRQRVASLARRFAPAVCVAMADGSRMDWDGAHLTIWSGISRLGSDGSCRTVQVP